MFLCFLCFQEGLNGIFVLANVFLEISLKDWGVLMFWKRCRSAIFCYVCAFALKKNRLTCGLVKGVDGCQEGARMDKNSPCACPRYGGFNKYSSACHPGVNHSQLISPAPGSLIGQEPRTNWLQWVLKMTRFNIC